MVRRGPRMKPARAVKGPEDSSDTPTPWIRKASPCRAPLRAASGSWAAEATLCIIGGCRRHWESSRAVIGYGPLIQTSYMCV